MLNAAQASHAGCDSLSTQDERSFRIGSRARERSIFPARLDDGDGVLSKAIAGDPVGIAQLLIEGAERAVPGRRSGAASLSRKCPEICADDTHRYACSRGLSTPNCSAVGGFRHDTDHRALIEKAPKGFDLLLRLDLQALPIDEAIIKRRIVCALDHLTCEFGLFV